MKLYKENTIKQFLIIKLINEKIEKLTLNNSTINSVKDLINDFSLNNKFIEDRQYFNEIINEYEDIVEEIGNKSPLESINIYKRYGLTEEYIKKIDE